MTRRAPFSALAVIVLLPLSARAQIFRVAPETEPARGTWTFDVGAQYANPIGEFRSQVARAWGAGFAVRKHFRAFPLLGIRGDVSLLNYGSEHKHVPLSSSVNRVTVDMNTQNNIVVLGLGPELALQLGRLSPYAYATVGYSSFFTQTSAGDDDGHGAFASTTNFADGGLATTWGGGLRVPLHVKSVLMAVDAGARMTHNGVRTYLRRGDIEDQPDGSLVFNSRTTPANFWQFHAGVSFFSRKR